MRYRERAPPQPFGQARALVRIGSAQLSHLAMFVWKRPGLSLSRCFETNPAKVRQRKLPYVLVHTYSMHLVRNKNPGWLQREIGKRK